MFLKAMIVYLLYWLNIILSLIVIFYNLDMDRHMVVRVEHKAESEKYKYMLAYCFFSTNLRVISVSSKVTYIKIHLNLSILPIINRLYCRLKSSGRNAKCRFAA